MPSRSRKSRRGLRNHPPFFPSTDRHTTAAQYVDPRPTNQPTNSRHTPSTPSYYYRCSSAAMPATDATDARSASMKMTSRQKAPRLIIKATRLAPRARPGPARLGPRSRVSVRECVSVHCDDDRRRGIAARRVRRGIAT